MNQITIDVSTDLGSSSTGQRMILKDGSVYVVTDQDFQIFTTAYPMLDVNNQLNLMVVWLYANPSKRKTKKGVVRFINSWLSRTQTGNTSPQPRFQRANTGVETTRDRAIETDLSDRSWAE